MGVSRYDKEFEKWGVYEIMSFEKLLNGGMVEWGRALGYSRADIVGMVEEVYEGIRKTL